MTRTTSPRPATQRGRAADRGAAECAAEDGPIGRHRAEPGGSGGGARRLRAACPGNGDDRGRAVEQPREGDLRRSRVVRGATSRNACRARLFARRGPPSGEWAITAMPASAQRSTRPYRRRGRRTTFSATWTAVDVDDIERLVELLPVDVGDPHAAHHALVQSRPSARTDVGHGVRGSGACEHEVDREAVERGEARFAIGEHRRRGRRGSSRRRYAPSHLSSRSARCRRAAPRSARASSRSL